MSTIIVNTATARIRHIAMAVKWTAIAAMVCIVLVAGYSLLAQTTTWTMTPTPSVTAHAQASPNSETDPQLALWLELLPEAALFYGLIRLVQMMRACERGEIFSTRVSTHLQAFSMAIVIAQLLDITLSLQIVALRALLGRANTGVGLTATGDQLWSLLLAALFLVLAQILKEAARVAEDNASIV
jgi:hypothetical protein